MKVCIVGCGAVGSLFAANLATLDDVEVWAYDLAQAHVDAINRDGLTLTGAGEVVGHPHATSDASELPQCDFGIVATKAMHTAPAIAATAHAFAGGSVATVQNGIGNEEVLARHVERVIRGTTFPAGKITAPGVVQWDVQGDTTLGPFEDQPAAFAEVERLADACTRAGMPTKAVVDARGPQWRKVIFNAATNPLGALTGLTHGRLCERPDLRRARLAPRRRGQGGCLRTGDRARRGSRGTDRLCGAARSRLRPQGLDAPGRRGAAADGGRLPERRDRRVRAAARGSDADTRIHLGTREGG